MVAYYTLNNKKTALFSCFCVILMLIFASKFCIMKKVLNSLIFRLAFGVALGVVAGLYLPLAYMRLVLAVKHILGQVIFFCVPLIILGFVAPAIPKMGKNASKMLFVMLGLAYLSSIGAAFFSMGAGYALIPSLGASTQVSALNELPELIFKLDIPQVMPVMSALVLAIFLGLAAAWTESKKFIEILDEFNNMLLFVVQKIIIPILPVFIASTFAMLAYEGGLTEQLPVFFKVIVLVILGHFIWMFFLYTLAAIVSGKNPLPLLKSYIPAYLTAVGTMSSAATLPVSLRSAKDSKVLKDKFIDFAIPLGATTHLCGSVLTEVFFVMTVSQILYGTLPDLATMSLFIVLLGVFAIGAPGVPGGTVMASLGLISGVLGFDETGIALMLTIFALQDSFGTACNVSSDGALALMMQGFFDKDGESPQA